VTTRALQPHEVALIEVSLARAGRYRDRLMLLLMVSTGYRISELLTLRVGQLTTPEGQVVREVSVARRNLKGGRGAHAKGVRSRRVVLNDRARLAIGDYLAALRVHPTADTYVFRSLKGSNEPIRRGQAFHVIKSAAQNAGLDSTFIGSHSCRKAFAKAMFTASGNSLIAVQRLLNHRSPMTTAAYLETTREELDALVLGVDPLAPAARVGDRCA
jgi:integrase